MSLALGVMLVATLLAVPSLAQASPQQFSAAAGANPAESFDQFEATVTLTNLSQGGPGQILGSANIRIPVGLSQVTPRGIEPRGTVALVDDTIQLRDLAIPRRGSATVSFSVTVDDCGQSTYPLQAQAKQANDFQGTGNDLALVGDQPVLELDCTAPTPPYLLGLDDLCDTGGVCSGQVGNVRLATAASGQTLLAGLREPGDDVAGVIATRFDAACDELVAGRTGGADARLANGILQVEPIGFTSGGVIELTNTIPRDVVRAGENRSAEAFGVCFMGVAGKWPHAEGGLTPWPELGSLAGIDGVPPLHAPVLLPTCDTVGGHAPCIVKRTKQGQSVTVTYVIPAEDPWMR